MDVNKNENWHDLRSALSAAKLGLHLLDQELEDSRAESRQRERSLVSEIIRKLEMGLIEVDRIRFGRRERHDCKTNDI